MTTKDRTQEYSQLGFKYEKELGEQYMSYINLVENHKYRAASVLLLKSILHYKAKKHDTSESKKSE